MLISSWWHCFNIRSTIRQSGNIAGARWLFMWLAVAASARASRPSTASFVLHGSWRSKSGCELSSTRASLPIRERPDGTDNVHDICSEPYVRDWTRQSMCIVVCRAFCAAVQHRLSHSTNQPRCVTRPTQNFSPCVPEDDSEGIALRVEIGFVPKSLLVHAKRTLRTVHLRACCHCEVPHSTK
jgi:hypothetical protein